MKRFIVLFFCMLSTLCFAQGNAGQSNIEEMFEGNLSYAQMIAKIDNPTLQNIEKIALLYVDYSETYEIVNVEGKTYSRFPYVESGIRNAFAAYLDMMERFRHNADALEVSLFSRANLLDPLKISFLFDGEDGFSNYREKMYGDYISIVELKTTKNCVDIERMKEAYNYLIYFHMKNNNLPKAQEYAKRYLNSGIIERIDNKEDEKERLKYILGLDIIPDE